MAKKGVIFNENAAGRITTAVRHFENTYRDAPKVGVKKVIRGGGSNLQIREGFLDGALAPSTDNGTTETTATLSVWKGSGADWADSGEDVTVTNRNDHLAASAGDYLICVKLPSGEIRPIDGETTKGLTCLSSIDGFVLDQLDEDTEPAYVLGLSAGGCMVLIPVEECS